MINTDDIVKGDGAMVLAVFPEGRKDSGKSKLIGFYPNVAKAEDAVDLRRQG